MSGEVDEFLQQWKQWIEHRDEDAAEWLVHHYAPLVNYHVQRLAATLPKNIDRDELKSLALIGLYDALEKFDHSRDLKFDTYASFRIKGTILDGLRKEDWLPRSSREKTKKIEAMAEQLEQQLQRKATPKEIAKELEVSEQEVYDSMNEGFVASVLSLDDQPKNSEDGEDLLYTIRDERQPSPEEALLNQQVFKELVEVIKQLSEREQLVISLFYKEELTLTEIGQILGLSTSRISQIHSKAINRMKKILGQTL